MTLWGPDFPGPSSARCDQDLARQPASWNFCSRSRPGLRCCRQPAQDHSDNSQRPSTSVSPALASQASNLDFVWMLDSTLHTLSHAWLVIFHCCSLLFAPGISLPLPVTALVCPSERCTRVSLECRYARVAVLITSLPNQAVLRYSRF